ncbi:hypothetical protein QZH41_011520 [Actinostola sp. cb2023]|nr:hypothetical protein QZH41_011520 [Actinostola sp. cb2023]
MMEYEYEIDPRGLQGKPGSVSLKKDKQNLIGISIGGGAPLCPCLYVVQVFDNTPASKEGTLQAGDEIVGVNGKSLRGKTKVDVARAIQAVKEEVIINYVKLHADPKEGKTLDIVMKKMKHRMVENMSSSTADALGLSRAILCNDGLVKKLEELEQNSNVYKGLVDHVRQYLHSFWQLSQTHKELGDIFASVGVRELQPNASEAFAIFSEAHRNFEKLGMDFLKTVKPMLTDLNTYLCKAIPDTRLTIRKYADAKFEYLSYCLKVKEMDDEEYAYAVSVIYNFMRLTVPITLFYTSHLFLFQALHESLYRVETGNYDYRVVLRCRQLARERFAKLRQDVLIKLELLDQKHVQDIVVQLQRFVSAVASYHNESYSVLKDANVFPIEVDLTRGALGSTLK